MLRNGRFNGLNTLLSVIYRDMAEERDLSGQHK